MCLPCPLKAWEGIPSLFLLAFPSSICFARPALSPGCSYHGYVTLLRLLWVPHGAWICGCISASLSKKDSMPPTLPGSVPSGWPTFLDMVSCLPHHSPLLGIQQLGLLSAPHRILFHPKWGTSTSGWTSCLTCSFLPAPTAFLSSVNTLWTSQSPSPGILPWSLLSCCFMHGSRLKIISLFDYMIHTWLFRCIINSSKAGSGTVWLDIEPSICPIVLYNSSKNECMHEWNALAQWSLSLSTGPCI